jgi:enoyl-CoA hydratase/carnithine racemase
MSVSPDHETMSSIATDTVKSGAIGGGAMLARILASNEAMAVVTTIRRATAAVLTAWIANYYLLEQVQSSGARAAACGLVGMASPEILEMALRWIKTKGSSYVDQAEKQAGIKLKSNGKTKSRSKKR